MRTIKLMLADDHDIVRKGLVAYLDGQPDLLVVAEARDGEEAVNLAREVRPDVIVMDITMEGMDGLEATRRIKMICPECKVLALTVHADKQYFFEMLSMGAEGYVTKQAAAEELVEAIRVVAEGHVYLQPALARWLLEDYKRISLEVPEESRAIHKGKPERSRLDMLTKREQQVLELVAEGYSSPQIGEMLGISPKTVARHRERIMGKLDLHSCADLVKFAVRTGLIDLD